MHFLINLMYYFEKYNAEQFLLKGNVRLRLLPEELFSVAGYKQYSCDLFQIIRAGYSLHFS